MVLQKEILEVQVIDPTIDASNRVGGGGGGAGAAETA